MFRAKAKRFDDDDDDDDRNSQKKRADVVRRGQRWRGCGGEWIVGRRTRATKANCDARANRVANGNKPILRRNTQPPPSRRRGVPLPSTPLSLSLSRRPEFFLQPALVDRFALSLSVILSISISISRASFQLAAIRSAVVHHGSSGSRRGVVCYTREHSRAPARGKLPRFTDRSAHNTFAQRQRRRRWWRPLIRFGARVRPLI